MRRILIAIVLLASTIRSEAAMTTDQKADALFKASMGVGNSAPAKQFFEQPTKATPVVLPETVWQEAASIPATAPSTLLDQQTSGVVKRWIDLTLTLVSGSTQSYTHAALADAIPFNYGDGTSYNYVIKDSTGTVISFGTNDWVMQNGLLTFYAGAPANMPPKISFYQYVGLKGVGSSVAAPQYCVDYFDGKDSIVPGPAATVAVGTTTTGAAGSNSAVTNSGSSSAAVFNFTIPRGDTGSIGPGVAIGGITGQQLRKKTNTDYDTEWFTPSATVNWGNILGTITDQTDLQSVLSGKEPANSNIQAHIGSTNNPHSTTANQVLPSQTGNNGKVLGTDGTNASWVAGGGGASDRASIAAALATTPATNTPNLQYKNTAGTAVLDVNTATNTVTITGTLVIK